MNTKNELREEIIHNLPHLLTQLDRDSLSPTFGCFDRNFWHYKIRSFPSFVLQQGIFSLTLLYKNKFKGNYFYKNPKILNYIKGSVSFWCKYQHRSGGFDEYWPNENSFPPLVFSFFSLLVSCRELNLYSKDILIHIKKAYERLLQQEEVMANNQESVALAAIYEYYLLKKDKQILKNFQKRLDNLLSRQTVDGWFPEHGGADIGYSSVILFYLYYLYKLTKNPKILNSLNKLTEFLNYFIHPDGSCGGEYGSRNTEYFLLGGLSPFLLQFSSKTMEIFLKLDKKLDKFDERYLFHYIFPSYIFSFLEWKKFGFPNKTAVLQERYFSRYFSESGLYVRKNKKTYFVANLKKGGTFKIFNYKKLIANDCGYRLKKNNNTFKVSSWINDKGKIMISKNKLSIKSSFFKNKFFTPSCSKQVLLYALNFAFGKKMVFLLKKLLIFQDQKEEDKFNRSINFFKNKIIINDNLTLTKKLPIYRMYEGSMRVVPSSNFFSENSFNLEPTETLLAKKKIKIKKIIKLT